MEEKTIRRDGMGLKMNVLTFCLALVIESRRPGVAGFVSTIKEWGVEKNLTFCIVKVGAPTRG